MEELEPLSNRQKQEFRKLYEQIHLAFSGEKRTHLISFKQPYDPGTKPTTDQVSPSEELPVQ